jgi:hypothetical protein
MKGRTGQCDRKLKVYLPLYVRQILPLFVNGVIKNKRLRDPATLFFSQISSKSNDFWYELKPC